MESQSGFFINPQEADEGISFLERVHSEGAGFTELYRSRQGGKNRLYKCLKQELRGNPLYENLLRKEFEIGFVMSHPGICEYYAFLQKPQLGHCIEMEWIDGKTLSERIREKSLSKKISVKILLDLCDALSYMHRKQIIHRDLKPENIMVTDNGDNVKIIDFGFSDSDSHFLGKTPAGTREFASPELLEGKEIDCRSDIYSLGKIMCLIPANLSSIAKKCTQKDKHNRYGSVEEVKQAILKSQSKRRWPIILGILLCVVGILLYLAKKRAENKVYKMFEETRDLIIEAGSPEPSEQE